MALGAVASIGTQLIMVPAAIAAWGAPHYGEWVVISGAVTVFQLADVGLQTYVINSVCASYARGDLAGFEETIRDALAVQVRIVIALLALLSCFLWLAPVNGWLRLHTVDRFTAAVVLGLLSCDLLLSIPLGVVAGIYRATGRLVRNGMMGVIQRTGLLLIAVALLHLHKSFLWIATARLCVTLSGAIWLRFDLPRLYPWLKIRIAGADLRRGFRMLLPGALFLLVPAADYATNQISLMIAQRQLSGVEVAILSTHRTIFNSAQMASNFLLLAVWPELTMIYARDDKDKMRRLLSLLTRINCFAVLLTVAGLLTAGQWLYPMWTRKSLHFDSGLAGLLAVETLCWGYWSVSSMVLMSVNRPGFVAKSAAWNGAIAVALAFALIPRVGIRGAAMASLIADLAVSVWFIPRCASTLAGTTYGDFLAGPTRTVFLALAIPALLIGGVLLQPAGSAAVRSGLLLAAAGALAAGARFAFDSEERAFAAGMISRLAGSIRRRSQ
jgi:O-antigen/teichoic acid export membrane protein